MRDIQKVFKSFILSICMFFILSTLYLITWGVRGYNYTFPLGIIFMIMSIVISHLIINRD